MEKMQKTHKLKVILDQVELETYYPKIMLEQRMNSNVHFREGNTDIFQQDGDDLDFDFDLDGQLNKMT